MNRDWTSTLHCTQTHSHKGGESPVWEQAAWVSRTRRPRKLWFRVTSEQSESVWQLQPPSSHVRSPPRPCDSAAPRGCFQACSPQPADESLNSSLLFLERIPFLCGHVSAPKGTAAAARPHMRAAVGRIGHLWADGTDNGRVWGNALFLHVGVHCNPVHVDGRAALQRHYFTRRVFCWIFHWSISCLH